MMAANFNLTEKQIKTEFTQLFLIRMGKVAELKANIDKAKAQRRRQQERMRNARR